MNQLRTADTGLIMNKFKLLSNTMRTALLFLLCALLFTACKSGRQMTAVEPPPQPVYEPVAGTPEPVIEAPEEIFVAEESFDFEREEDEVLHEVNRFFVILGSFRVGENAGRFMGQLEERGFDPVVLVSGTGFNRVCVDSYVNETDARQRVLQIRRSFPEFHDAWLLIRK